MPRITLGGDRLGAGNKNQIDLHNYSRSTFDLSQVFRSTMSAGTLVPFLSLLGLPGDTLDIKLNANVKTHPTLGPLFGSMKLQLDIFQAPWRLYIAKLHNNALNVGKTMNTVYVPLISLEAWLLPNPMLEGTDLDNCQVNPSCLLAYLGIRGIGLNQADSPSVSREFNAIPILMYWELLKNYYSNKQEEDAYVIHTPGSPIITTITTIEINGTVLPTPPAANQPINMDNSNVQIDINFAGAQPDPSQVMILTSPGGLIQLDQLGIQFVLSAPGVLTAFYNFAVLGSRLALNWQYKTALTPTNNPPQLHAFPLTNIDEMRIALLQANINAPFIINTTLLEPYRFLHEDESNQPFILNSQEGLAVKTYQNDLLNNWLFTDNIDAIAAATAIDTSAGSFTIDTLRLSNKMNELMQRIAVSSGTWNDYLKVVYTDPKHSIIESPMYHGGLIKEIAFQEVVSNTTAEGTSNGGQPLGTLSGKGVMTDKHKGGTVIIKCEEPTYIMGIVSITPRIDYSQGNNWDMHLQTVDDLHKSALDQIGFQDLIFEQAAWWTTSWNTISNQWEQLSVGKQPAWMNYMTAINRTYGNFALQDNEMFMTLNRRYEYDSAALPTDITTYIDPVKFNFIFAQTSRDAQNFWVQISMDIECRRLMSSKQMPNL